MNNKNSTYSLLEFNYLLKNIIDSNFTEYISISAEINSININSNGNCFLELIEKDHTTNNIISKAKASIWATNYRLLAPYFKSVTGQDLSAGIKILFKAYISYHEVFGININIIDIDPNYTLGDIERQKQLTIQRLEDEGVISMNKELEIPEIIKNIAIISSTTAAGYDDFTNQILNNSQNFKFNLQLFETVMQGNKAEDSIINSLNNIFEHSHLFDLVVIIRGGGAKSDLNIFDNYNLAYYITQFPLPIISGIGHNRDNSVIDIVANVSLKTPTAVAEFIITNNLNFKQRLNFLVETFHSQIEKIILDNNNKITKISETYASKAKMLISNNIFLISTKVTNFKNTVEAISNNEKYKIKTLTTKTLHLNNLYFSAQKLNINKFKHSINDKTKLLLLTENSNIKIFDLKIEANSPEKILKKGYSIITHNNKIVKDFSLLNNGDEITNIVKTGEIVSQIKFIK